VDKTVLAVIPARGGSKGIPRKNLKEIKGKPLVAIAIEQALSSQFINRTLVSSEDKEIQDVAETFGAEVIGRPDEFIHDDSIQEVDRLLAWTVLHLESRGDRVDVVVLLYPTAPLRQVGTIDRAIQMVVEEGFTSVLSLYEDSTYLWRRVDGAVEPVNYIPSQRGPRQKEAWNQWAENKGVYVMTGDCRVNSGCRLCGKSGCVEMPRWRSIDVDEPEDLELVRLLFGK